MPVDDPANMRARQRYLVWTRVTRPGAAGVTLVELLVVVAIIGVLAGLLLPLLGRARASGRAVACRSNLRQLAAGMLLYADTHDGILPSLESQSGSYWWQNQMASQLADTRAVFKCPTTGPEFRWETNFASLSAGGFLAVIRTNVHLSYGYNGTGSFAEGVVNAFQGLGLLPEQPVRIQQVNRPADLIAVGDSDGDGVADGQISFARIRAVNRLWNPPGRRHSGGANVAFVDGHVEWRTQTNWIRRSVEVAQSWNRDHRPHRETW